MTGPKSKLPPATASAPGSAGVVLRDHAEKQFADELAALAKVDGRVCAFLEPIALYMTKDLYEAGDGGWLTTYPTPDQAMTLGEGRVYGEGEDLVIFTFGNGVPMSLRAAREIEAKQGWKTRVVDLRWLQPLTGRTAFRLALSVESVDGKRTVIEARVGEGAVECAQVRVTLAG